jgi:hypothetical protein
MLKVTIHSVGSGACSLAGKEGDGLTVTFEDGTVREAFLSWKSFRQLCAMKSAKGAKQPEARPVITAMPANGPALAVK